MTPLVALQSAEVAACKDACARLRAAASASAAEVHAIVACLRSEDAGLRREASDALVALHQAGVDVVDSLERSLSVYTDSGLWAAAFTLARIGPPSDAACAALTAALGSSSSDERWAASEAISRWTPTQPRLWQHLVDSARHHDPVRRRMVLYCLRNLGRLDQDVVTIIEAGLRDPYPHVRLSAISAVTACYQDAAALMAAMTIALADPEPGVRRAAMASLRRARCRRSELRPLLERHLLDSDELVRRLAKEMLAEND